MVRQWWGHGEAISGLNSLWHAWEVLRHQPGTGIGIWSRVSRPPVPPPARRPRPLYQCSETTHREPQEPAAPLRHPATGGSLAGADDLPDPLPGAGNDGPGDGLRSGPCRRLTPADRGLDPAHILSVASQAIRGGHGHASRAVTSPGGSGCASHRGSLLATPLALIRVGYQVARIDGTAHRDLLVSGWNADRLEARLTAMRAVQHRLNESPASTADAVIERVRRLPPRSADHPETTCCANATASSQSSVAACSGIHASRNPAIVPAGTGNALRSSSPSPWRPRSTTSSSATCGSPATRCVCSFPCARMRPTSKPSRPRSAGPAAHLPPEPVPGSGHPRPAPAPRPAARARIALHRPAPDGRADGGAAQQAASGFPYPVRGAGTDARAVPAARPAELPRQPGRATAADHRRPAAKENGPWPRTAAPPAIRARARGERAARSHRPGPGRACVRWRCSISSPHGAVSRRPVTWTTSWITGSGTVSHPLAPGPW